jgi:glycerophosphoryl diester phosphodiesterase
MYSPATNGVVKYYILKTVGLDFFFREKICVFQIPMEKVGINLATKSLVKNAHKHNIAVHYWTIDDKETMRELIDIGADGIMTNYPHRLKEVLDERAQRMTADA